VTDGRSHKKHKKSKRDSTQADLDNPSAKRQALSSSPMLLALTNHQVPSPLPPAINSVPSPNHHPLPATNYSSPSAFFLLPSTTAFAFHFPSATFDYPSDQHITVLTDSNNSQVLPKTDQRRFLRAFHTFASVAFAPPGVVKNNTTSQKTITAVRLQLPDRITASQQPPQLGLTEGHDEEVARILACNGNNDAPSSTEGTSLSPFRYQQHQHLQTHNDEGNGQSADQQQSTDDLRACKEGAASHVTVFDSNDDVRPAAFKPISYDETAATVSAIELVNTINTAYPLPSIIHTSTVRDDTYGFHVESPPPPPTSVVAETHVTTTSSSPPRTSPAAPSTTTLHHKINAMDVVEDHPASHDTTYMGFVVEVDESVLPRLHSTPCQPSKPIVANSMGRMDSTLLFDEPIVQRQPPLTSSIHCLTKTTGTTAIAKTKSNQPPAAAISSGKPAVESFYVIIGPEGTADGEPATIATTNKTSNKGSVKSNDNSPPCPPPPPKIINPPPVVGNESKLPPTPAASLQQLPAPLCPASSSSHFSWQSFHRQRRFATTRVDLQRRR